MLSDREQRELALIEQGLCDDDRGFVASFSDRSGFHRRRWPIRALTCSGVLVALVGVFAATGELVVQGLLIAGAGVAWRWWQRTRTVRALPPADSDRAKPEGGTAPPEGLRPV